MTDAGPPPVWRVDIPNVLTRLLYQQGGGPIYTLDTDTTAVTFTGTSQHGSFDCAVSVSQQGGS